MAELGAKITAELIAVPEIAEHGRARSFAYGSTLSKATGELDQANLTEGKI